jgi:hypothetical protein
MEQSLPLQGHCSDEPFISILMQVIHCHQSSSIIVPLLSIAVHPRLSLSISIAIVSRPSPLLSRAAHCHPIHEPSSAMTAAIHLLRATIDMASRPSPSQAIQLSHPLPSRPSTHHPLMSSCSVNCRHVHVVLAPSISGTSTSCCPSPSHCIVHRASCPSLSCPSCEF